MGHRCSFEWTLLLHFWFSYCFPEVHFCTSYDKATLKLTWYFSLYLFLSFNFYYHHLFLPGGQIPTLKFNLHSRGLELETWQRGVLSIAVRHDLAPKMGPRELMILWALVGDPHFLVSLRPDLVRGMYYYQKLYSLCGLFRKIQISHLSTFKKYMYDVGNSDSV